VVQRKVAGGPSLYIVLFNKSAREQYQYKFLWKNKSLACKCLTNAKFKKIKSKETFCTLRQNPE
jgi:hypothetical protein